MKSRKIQVGSVSYLNAKPLIYGFENGIMKEKLDLVIDYPSSIANKLKENEIDIGLVPVAIIPSLSEYHIVSDYCIGCDGEVASVCLFSEVPIHEIETVLLDYQSRTSVALLKILLKEHWKVKPRLENAGRGYEMSIAGTTAGLVIGDRALEQRSRSKFIYDLGLAWKDMTGMPFVFAAWISNKKIDPDFLVDFNNANKNSLQNLEVILQKTGDVNFDARKYFTENIKYYLDASKRNALEYFLGKLSVVTYS